MQISDLFLCSYGWRKEKTVLFVLQNIHANANIKQESAEITSEQNALSLNKSEGVVQYPLIKICFKRHFLVPNEKVQTMLTSREAS